MKKQSRIRRGLIVTTRSGLCVVVGRYDGAMVLVSLQRSPLPAHRADIHPSWEGRHRLKLVDWTTVRCVPFITDKRNLYSAGVEVGANLMHRIDKAVAREIAQQREENRGRFVLPRRWRNAPAG